MTRSSLIGFHRVLISAGILFCAGFAAWAFHAAAAGGRVSMWTLGTVFAILAIGLGVYLWNLRRILGYGESPTRRR
ncbi:MAG: hypothetical protein ABR527_06055 [Gemmatimonadota bacterium]